MSDPTEADVFPHFARTAGTVQSLALAALPHGGQRAARRNAWASMSEGAARARGRRDADAAMDQAIARSRFVPEHQVAR